MIEQIKNSDIEAKKVANLPSHPNAPKAMGGGGFTAKTLKERYDALAILAIDKLKEIISALTAAPGEGSLADQIMTAKTDNEGNPYTLSALFSHIIDGTLATYLQVGEKSLQEVILENEENFEEFLLSISKAPGAGSIADQILTAKTDPEGKRYTLSALFSHIIDGTLATYLHVGGKPLDVVISEIPSEIPNEIYVGSGGSEDEIPNGAVVQFVIEEDDLGDSSNIPIFIYFKSGDTLNLVSGAEYRAKDPIDSCTFTFPGAPKDDFVCSFELDTGSGGAISLSCIPEENQPYITGDDCAQGVFSPKKSKHYSLLFWYDGLRMQGIARGVSI